MCSPGQAVLWVGRALGQQHGGATAWRCSRCAPAIIARSGMLGRNRLVRVITERQHGCMLRGRARRAPRGIVVGGRRRCGEPPASSQIYLEFTPETKLIRFDRPYILASSATATPAPPLSSAREN